MCDKCNDTGQYVDELTGLVVKCDCKNYQTQIDVTKNIVANVSQGTTKGNIESAVNNYMVPVDRANDNFDVKILIERIKTFYGNSGYNMVKDGFDRYRDTLQSIMGSIIINEKVKRSYIISAPNACSKTTFANHMIKIMHANGKKVVPYITMTKLHELMVMHYTLLDNAWNRTVSRANQKYKNEERDIDYKTKEEKYIDTIDVNDIVSNFNWKDYINADCIFLSLGQTGLQRIEVVTLKAILTERARFNRPTIVMADVALREYTSDQEFNRSFWSDYVEWDDRACINSYDIMKYVSCYKVLAVRKGVNNL